MSHINKRVPKRRFEEFNNVDAWEQRKLGDYAEILTGGTPKTSISEYWEPKRIPWMSSGEVNKRRLDGTDNMISEEGLNNSNARWVKEHSVLIALAGQGKTRGTVAVNNIKLTTNQSIAAIVPNDNLHHEFIYQNLIKRYDELRMISSGDGTRGGLNKRIVSDILLLSPSKEEQIKIGTFLKQLDDTFALHQRKLEKIKALKAAYLSEMFPAEGETKPKRRFAGFTDDWEQGKLEELAAFSKGSGYTKNDLVEKGMPLVLYGRLYTKYETIITEVNTFTKMKDKSVISKGNEVVVPSSGETAKDISRASVIGAEGFILGGDLNIIKPKRELNSIFLALTISNGEQQKEIIKRAQGKSVVHVYNTDLKQVKLSYPTFNEQEKIGSFFRQLDNAIALHQRKLQKLQNIKKAYLNEMFI
ncbi:restriction endonuclease subunit S [Listeria monocytogenes]|uniref:restriction endonuclease subunit S n=1 Tax=Listeria TaxID=1637 RepID=UPI00165DCE3D|nr:MULTISPECIES: restriction endonuclease subunit S [Listeria]EHU6364815.1 restriction endonuclease subunit S [Listeria monocytogenes]EHW3871892.1 restriction endonuclease subunit S [Listeria monocytogenes]EHW3874669.1 restriction endonuclease subunit S [Listeria monocytogenes]EHW3877535.1 restriction endonuclease subunit S [Listeria monocytogenes]EHW3881500.1 restriction endonuclease subunit S [Listeria monocytogenes]